MIECTTKLNINKAAEGIKRSRQKIQTDSQEQNKSIFWLKQNLMPENKTKILENIPKSCKTN